MSKKKKPENAIFYGNYKEMIYSGSPEDVKEIMVAFCEYAFDNKEPKVSPRIALAWGIIKGNIDSDRKQYMERCEKNRRNAKKRYEDGDEDESVVVQYHMDGVEYEAECPIENKRYLPSQTDFAQLFCEIENDPIARMKGIGKFIKMGNEDEWEKPFEEYERAAWEHVFDEQ